MKHNFYSFITNILCHCNLAFPRCVCKVVLIEIYCSFDSGKQVEKVSKLIFKNMNNILQSLCFCPLLQFI